MSRLLVFPSEVLVSVADEIPLTSTDEKKGLDSPEVQAILDAMAAKSLALNGLGVAAPQIGHKLRAFVVTQQEADPVWYINPKLVHGYDPETMREGCLSVPEIFVPVTRFQQVEVEHYDRHGELRTALLYGEHAHIFQHELDHLDGKLIVSYLDAPRRAAIRASMIKYKQRYGATR